MKMPIASKLARPAAVAAIVLAAAGARAETSICTVITTLPAVITQSGAYCLDRDLTTPMASGMAVFINASDVQLDLNGFKIETTAGAANTAFGILSDTLPYRKNVVVRNGAIKGFHTGLSLGGNTGLLAEGIRVIDSKSKGIFLKGVGGIVRQNLVTNTTGSTATTNASAYGLWIEDASARVTDNDVVDTVGTGTGAGYGIYGNGCNRAFFENNRVGLTGPVLTNTKGIYLVGVENGQVVNNRMTLLTVGMEYGAGSSGKYRDNLTVGCTTTYVGGTNAGNNQ
jgi:hypothetical protein